MKTAIELATHYNNIHKLVLNEYIAAKEYYPLDSFPELIYRINMADALADLWLFIAMNKRLK